MKIGIDLDSTLNRLDLVWAEWIRKTHAPDFKLEHWTRWSLHELVPAGKKIYDFLDMHGTFRDLPVAEGSQAVVKELQDAGHEVFIVTACHLRPGRGHIVEEKLEWLWEHFPDIDPANIFFMRKKGLLKMDVLVDDGPHNFEGFEGYKILIDGPWNQQQPHTCARARGWSDVREMFKTMGALK